MSITEAQRQARKNHLGGSDIPAILGFSRFATPYDVWLLKTGRVTPKERTESYITAGQLLEAPLIEWLSTHLNEDIDTEPDRMELAVPDSPIVVHTDGIMKSTGNPVEGKTEGVDHPIIEPWGESGTDEVPEYTCLQAHSHLMATDKEICHVPTFLGGRGFGYFFVKRDNRLVDMIRKQAIHFWEDHVLKDVPPEDCAPSLTMIKQIRRVEGDPVALDSEMVHRWLDAKESLSATKKAVEFEQAGILADMDGIEIGKYQDGEGIERFVTNFEQNRKGYEVKPTSFRVMRTKKKL